MLHLVGFLFTLNYDARNHELKFHKILLDKLDFTLADKIISH